MKKIKSFVWLVAIFAGIIGTSVSCFKDPADLEPEQDEHLYTSEVIFNSTAYVAPDIDADLKDALFAGIKKISTAPDGSLPLLVVNKIGDLGETIIKDCYESGGTIAIVKPVKSEIDAFVDAHSWLDIITDNIEDGLMLYAFNFEGGYAHIYFPDDVDSYDSPSEAYFIFLKSWLTRLNEEYVLPQPFRSNNNDIPDLEALSNEYQDQVVYSYSKSKYTFRQLPLSDPDQLSGSGCMSIDYKVYMAHVYEGEPGAGDYYAVKITASMANEKMYQGRHWNKHGGTYVRYCGFYPTEGTFEIKLVNNKKEDYSVVFAGAPVPTTTPMESKYDDSQSFSLQASQSVTGSINKKGKGIQAEVGVTEGWEWTHSRSRTLPDMSISALNYGSVPKWSINYHNLPEYNYSCYRGFEVQDGSHAYSSTATFDGSWLWYDKTGKDDTYKSPLQLCFKMTAKYKIMSWISSKADLETDDINFDSGYVYRELPLINTNTAGKIVLNNDFADGRAIRDIEIKDADDGTVYRKISKTLANGKEMVLGTYTPLLNYVVSFTAVKAGGDDPHKYTYSAHKYFNVTHMETTTLYANYDFSISE